MSRYIDYLIEQEGYRSAEEMLTSNVPKKKHKTVPKCKNCGDESRSSTAHGNQGLCGWCRHLPQYFRGVR